MMKKSNPIEKIMHFLVHNSFLFTVIIMCLVHATLLVVALCNDIKPLFYFNIFSVAVYMMGVVLCIKGHIMPVYISIFLEVTTYSIFSVYYVGWKSGSQYFLFSIVPIIIYFGSFLFKGVKRWIIVLLLVIDFLVYVYLYFKYAEISAIYEVSYPIRSFLLIFTTFVLFFSMIFYYFIYIYSSEYEMTDLEQKNEKLSDDANRDALTDLLNRRGFLPVVGALMNKADSNHFCIAFCDIDNFKTVNDSYGHDCGDEVLRHVSKILRREMQNCNICRWGGEEMVILMKDYDLAVAKMKMEYLRKCIESNPTVFYNKRIPVTITIGLEEYGETHHKPEDVIKVADERMYYGKQHGKNMVVWEDAE